MSRENLSSGFPTRQAVQPQKMARGLKFWIKEVEGLYYLNYVAKTKALIGCVVTAQLICVFVFAYAKSRFSHDEAHKVVKVTIFGHTTYAGDEDLFMTFYIHDMHS